jgi:hypothetical protein
MEATMAQQHEYLSESDALFEACRDRKRFDLWTARAVTAETTADVFAAEPQRNRTVPVGRGRSVGRRARVRG